MGCGASKKEGDYKAPEATPQTAEKKPDAAVVNEVPATAAAAADEPDEDEDEDDNELGEDDFVEIDYSKLKGGRQSVAAEKTMAVSADEITKYEKSEEALARIRTAMDASFVFDALKEQEKMRVAESLKEVKLGPGETVIKQGDRVMSEDNGLFVLESGSAKVYKKANDGDEDPGEEKLTYETPGSTFGELALLYNAPRAATVITSSDCVMWALERQAFATLVQGAIQARRADTDQLLQKVEFLTTVDSEDRTRLADAVKYLHYKTGDVVFSQGDAGESMYIVASGKLSCAIDGNEVATFETAAFFGELALLNGNPRKATITATEASDIIAIDRAAFKRLLGKAEGFLRDYAKAKYGMDM